VGGAITTAPDMHRYLVDETHWLTDEKFNASIAIAQAAPGPNVLFIPLMGWQTGLVLGHGSWLSATAGMLATFIGILLPSSALMWTAARWLHVNRDIAPVRAFKAALAPVSVALILSTSWLLVSAHDHLENDWRLWLLSAAALVVVWRTNVHLLAVLATGAVLGALGLV
jgi:chromate transporter